MEASNININTDNDYSFIFNNSFSIEQKISLFIKKRLGYNIQPEEVRSLAYGTKPVNDGNGAYRIAQVKKQIEKKLYELGYQYEEITFLDFAIDGPRVRVSTNGEFFGVFNYEEFYFESTPDTRNAMRNVHKKYMEETNQ